MRVGVVTDRPEHPTLAAFAALARERAWRVEFLAPDADGPGDADLYLLKTRSPAGLDLGRRAEAAGVPVVNSAAATEACLDRLGTAATAAAAGLPMPATHGFADPGALAAAAARFGGRTLVLKSRFSSRANPVPEIGTVDELARAAAGRDEPVVVQEFAAGDGWDHKFWVIGGKVFAGLRRPPTSPAAAAGSKTTVELTPDQVPPAWTDLARAVGDAYGLQIYGVDLIATATGPALVDVNAFPGFRGIPEAPAALAELVARHTARIPPQSQRGTVAPTR
ncbi:ATP-grasp domain-containing protein [Yinghuangia seranimata]|uniref:ATP-grasp domain-containing protein n=1 Tax=Yinghuangia seranimata TaxID=408067 RepID=UPI00248C7B3B|nr:alpha-L-glutamate ligase [Yinghuangia seranimata]MDI2125560.1 alpha-L-glutamate ligase [Yinghuangia seranimata]